MGLRIRTHPTTEPVTLAMLKEHVRVTHYAEDALLAVYNTAARQWCENYCERAFFTQTWDYYADDFPCGDEPLIIDRPQYASVSSFTYKDTASASQTLTSADYQIESSRDPFRVYPALNEVWPLTDGSVDNVNFRFVAGWASVALVPQQIKQAIMMLAGEWYQHREPILAGMTVQNIPHAVESLLSPYKVWQYA